MYAFRRLEKKTGQSYMGTGWTGRKPRYLFIFRTMWTLVLVLWQRRSPFEHCDTCTPACAHTKLETERIKIFTYIPRSVNTEMFSLKYPWLLRKRRTKSSMNTLDSNQGVSFCLTVLLLTCCPNSLCGLRAERFQENIVLCLILLA